MNTNAPWSKFYAKAIDPHFQGDSNTLIDNLTDTVRDYGDNIALICEDDELTYNDMLADIIKFASSLKSIGVGKGTQVVLSLPNCIEVVIACYSCMAIGAIFILMNPAYKEFELQEMFDELKAEVLISTSDTITRTKGIIDITNSKLRNYISIDSEQDGDVLSFSTLLASGDEHMVISKPGLDDIACIQFTSGTTGKFKAAALTQENLSFDIAVSRHSYFDSIIGQEAFLCACPLFHILGFQGALNHAIKIAAKTIILPKAFPQKIIQAINEQGVTFAPLVPAHYIGLLAYEDLLRDSDFSKVKFNSGGAGIPIEVLERFESLTGKYILEGYGLTEASPVTHLNPHGVDIRKPGSIGIPYPGVDARIVDINDPDKTLAQGEKGELLVKGRNVCTTYYSNEREYQAIETDGWLHTGDLAYMDEDGFFYIADRIKDVIITSAFNVSPREIEEFLYRNNKVLKAAVIGIPDEKKGESIAAFIVLKDGETATEDEFIDYCKDGLVKYKCPSKVFFVDTLPENSLGKILKYKLKEDFITFTQPQES
jgi:long-chain acyl-CoA synthetase